MGDSVLVALVSDLTPTDKMIIIAVAFAYHLVTKFFNRNKKWSELESFARASIDTDVFEFEKTIDLLDIAEEDKDEIKGRYELFARTYGLSAFMSSIRKNGFKKYTPLEIDSYCKDVGSHIKNEIIRKLLVRKAKFPEAIKALGEKLYSTEETTKQYTRCVRKYLELNPTWWHFKIK